jgi:hypothetical protein
MNTNVLTQRCLLNPIELMLDLSVGTCAHFAGPHPKGRQIWLWRFFFIELAVA